MAATKQLKLAVLISGRGSNLQALIDACARDDFPATIETVISNIPDVFGLQRAKDAGLHTTTINHKNFNNRKEFEQALIDHITPHNVDLVCLAGFMRILSPHFINHYGQGRLINIHPSLLPKHKGLNTHQRALDAGDTEAGCTVHHVVPDVDSGEIIVQKSVPIKTGDTADTLAARILEQEHIAYPQAVLALAQNWDNR